MAPVYAVFKSSGTWQVPAGVTSVDVLLVAGGGGGRQKREGNIFAGAGGGAGGVLEALAYSVTPLATVPFIIGAGGAGGVGTTNTNAASGEDTTFESLTAVGGGRGGAGTGDEAAQSGGSGGGSGPNTTPTQGVSGQGNGGGIALGNSNRFRSGGGGGKSAAGQDGGNSTGGNGGDGVTLASIGWGGAVDAGAPSAVGGGGGGGVYGLGTAGSGGLGGGGSGGLYGSENGGNGGANTGGGGGGAYGDTAGVANGGAGGSGLLIIRYEAPTDIASDVTFNYELEAAPVVHSDVTFNYALEQSGIVVDLTINYEMPSGFVVTAVFNYEMPNYRPAHVTQVPMLALEMTYPPARVTQLPVIVLGLPDQPTRVTQLPVLVLRSEFPVPLPYPNADTSYVPLPAPIIPETPFTEIWSYLTVIRQADGGREQRAALRANPRYSYRFNALVLDESERRNVVNAVSKFLDKEFWFPAYQYGTPLLRAEDAGAGTLLFDPLATDVRAGEKVALINPADFTTVYADVDTITPTGATLARPLLPAPVGMGWIVCPSFLFRFPVPAGLTMQALTGDATLRIENTRARPLERLSGAAMLTMLGGLPVLDRRPMDDADETYSKGVEWRDNQTSIPTPRAAWRPVFMEGERSYHFRKYEQIAYWRAFADYTKGRQNTFLLPSFRDDLPLIEVPAPGATRLVTSNIQADEYIKSGLVNRYAMITSDAGVSYRRINDTILRYDANGDAMDMTLVLDAPIASPAIQRISFVSLARLDNDDIIVEHDYLDSTINLAIRTVDV